MNYYGDNTQPNKYNFASFFCNSAFACKCEEAVYEGAVEEISEINVFSLYPFTNSGTTANTLSKYIDIEGNFNGQRSDLISFTKRNQKHLSKSG